MSTDRAAKYVSRVKHVQKEFNDGDHNTPRAYIKVGDIVWIYFKIENSNVSRWYESEIKGIRETLTCATLPLQFAYLYDGEILKRFIIVSVKKACRRVQIFNKSTQFGDFKTEEFIKLKVPKLDESIFRIKITSVDNVRLVVNPNKVTVPEMIAKFTDKRCREELKLQGIKTQLKNIKDLRQLLIDNQHVPYLPARVRFLSTLKLPELKLYTKDAGVDISGRKQQIFDRLINFENAKRLAREQQEDEELTEEAMSLHEYTPDELVDWGDMSELESGGSDDLDESDAADESE